MFNIIINAILANFINIDFIINKIKEKSNDLYSDILINKFLLEGITVFNVMHESIMMQPQQKLR